MICTLEQIGEMERQALELERSRWADDQVDHVPQALNRLHAMVSLPKCSPPMPRPRRATPLNLFLYRANGEQNPIAPQEDFAARDCR